MESNQNVYFSKPVKELIISGESPIPLEVIPNYMGINLVSVKSIEWSRQKDGQLIDLKINFNPNNKELCDCGKMAEWCYLAGYYKAEWRMNNKIGFWEIFGDCGKSWGKRFYL